MRSSNDIQPDPSLRDCSFYGCPIYPPELDEVADALNKLKEDDNLKLPYGTKNMAILTRKSNRHNPPFNQDSLVLIDPFQTSWTKSYSSFFLAGVFDGHGDEGHLVSQMVARELPHRLAQKLNDVFQKQRSVLDDQEIIKALKETFVEVDVNLSPSAMRGGCTASVTLRIGSKLFIANAGDSRTIVVGADDSKNTTILYTSRLDKPHLPDERARIEGLGGNIHISTQHPEWSSVVVYSIIEREQVALAMSRSLGDWEWKVIGVIAEPIVDVFDLTNVSNAFLLAASDGLWDMRRPLFFANRFAESFFQEPMKHPLLTCQQVIFAASPLAESVYRDDISVLAVRLTHNNTYSPR